VSKSHKKTNIQYALSAKTYIANVTKKYKQLLGGELHKYKSTMDSAYHLELDNMSLLNDQKASLFQELIGLANWVIMFGCFDINFAPTPWPEFQWPQGKATLMQ